MQNQSLSTASLEMKEVIRKYVDTEIKAQICDQTTLLHREADAFKMVVRFVAKEV